ncbi:variant erythrocyte surface antigen-1 family protein [Babesia caballi]|uniref:Variant erythrocyte surface antigen-1 family protein n=1 Tax=Babesia caballi TaxID=5871 RepID=A0AAV4M1H6_BABCB|nr:variant erythrocyte surface antigen-1 family protein [Babesia caballi]
MGDGQKSGLIEWPEDLKDVIDWFLRVGEMDQGGSGNSNKTKLKDAVEKLVGFGEATKGLGKFKAHSVEGIFNYLTLGLQPFIGYDSNLRKLTGQGIGRNGNSPYTSSYTNKATWTEDSSNPTTCAQIFLGSAPILYFGLTYTYWKCSKNQSGHWGQYSLKGGGQSPLYLFMVNMGFKTTELQNINGSSVAESMARNNTYSFEELKHATKSPYSYSGFLEKVKQYGEQKLTSSPVDCSLYTLYRVSTAYLTSKFKEHQTNETPFDTIKQKLDKFSKSCWPSYTDLKGEFDNFLKEIGASQTPPSAALRDPSPSPSPAGPVAGTLTTLGLGGGAAAAYIFNLGGAKTLVNGLLRIG